MQHVSLYNNLIDAFTVLIVILSFASCKKNMHTILAAAIETDVPNRALAISYVPGIEQT
jgi:hypothetical protein